MPGIKQALIIAAGNGSRLQAKNGDTPKPLTPVCGIPLLKRILNASSRAGIESFVIVLGFQAEKIKQAITSDPKIKVHIDWVVNEDWRRANGLSVLKAKEFLKDDFVLLMADHLFQARMLSKLLRRRPSPGEVILAVDRKLTSIFDMDDATKVQLNGTRILNIGKEIKEYNAVDTGMFLCTPALFAPLEKALAEKGDCSLTDGMQALISESNLRFFDIQEDWWQDVDTPGALQHAEEELLERLRKPNDGFVSHYLNRPLSLRLTQFLAKTSITGNHITFFSLFVGVISAVLMAMGSYASVLAGAILFQFISILDGCDGELAKIRMEESERGRLWDHVADHLVYLLFLLGVMIGLFRQDGSSYILIVGLITFFDAALTLNIMYGHLRRTGDWSLLSYYQMVFPKDMSGLPRPEEGLFDYLGSFCKTMVRPDTFAFLTLMMAIWGNLSWILWAAFFATHLTTLAVLYGQSRIFAVAENSTH